MLPLLLGIYTNTSAASTELLFSESDIIGGNYMNVAKRSIGSDHAFNLSSKMFLESRFNELYNNWYVNTMFYSNPKMIIEDENFQGIIKLGHQTIPLILSKIENEPSQLVWALNIITKDRISNKKETLTISDACKRWVKFGKQNII